MFDSFVASKLNMLSWIMRLQVMETFSFCLLNLVGLVKCLAEFRVRLLVKDW